MAIQRTYSLAELSRLSGIDREILRGWVVKGWHTAKCRAGIRAKYTDEDYERACVLSKGLKPAPRPATITGGMIDYNAILRKADALAGAQPDAATNKRRRAE